MVLELRTTESTVTAVIRDVWLRRVEAATANKLGMGWKAYRPVWGEAARDKRPWFATHWSVGEEQTLAREHGPYANNTSGLAILPGALRSHWSRRRRA
jgi:hypothetical protein